jgi:hypothetical protein
MLLSIRAYAKHKGVSDTAVRKAIDAGRITMSGDKIDTDTADRQWAMNTNPAQSRKSADESSPSSSYQYSRAKKETYEALLKKLEYEERLGKLISVEKVEYEAFTAARIARDKLLAIPDRIAPAIIGKTEIFDIKEALRKEILDSLEHLTEFLDNGTE